MIKNDFYRYIVRSVCGFFTLDKVTKAKDLLFEVTEVVEGDQSWLKNEVICVNLTIINNDF